MEINNVISAMKYKHEYEMRLSSYTGELRKRTSEEKLLEFARSRKFPIEVLRECGIAYVSEMAEMIVPAYIDYIEELGVISPTNNKPIFNDRYIIPIKNTDGLVQNLVGYSSSADERYIYGTSRYYRRKETLWGLENLRLAYEMGYAIVVEGITDAIRLRSMGHKNTFAMCGTHKSDFIVNQLNRCRHGVIIIPDRDDAGIRALKNWDFNRHVTIYVNLKYKDVDEMCRDGAEWDENKGLLVRSENEEWLNGYISDCINWLKSSEHRGKKSVCEKITII